MQRVDFLLIGVGLIAMIAVASGVLY